MKTLKARLKEKIENIYLFEGDDYELYSRGFAMIKKAANLSLEDFNLSVFDDENFAIEGVLNACEMLPFGEGYKIVLIKNIGKIGENDKKMLNSYAKNPVSSTILIIFDFYNKFNFMKNNSSFVDCNRFDENMLSSIIVSELGKKNKQISVDGAKALIENCNNYLTRIMCELDKLVYFDQSQTLITKKMVDQLVSKDDEVIIFELTDALGARNADKALKIAEALKKESGLLGLITSHFRRLFFISISDLPDSELATLLGVKEFAITKQRRQIKNFSKMQLKKIYSLLEEVDYMIKSGAMLQENALNYLILSILYI